MLYLPASLRIKLAAGVAVLLLIAVIWLEIYANTQPGVQGTGQGLETATLTPTSAPLPVIYPATPTPVATPGLVVYGIVRDKNGAGIASVEIYRKYASYGGTIIATSDAQGYYQSDFYFIPGDEMVSIWASKPGVVFDPENHYWRHYYGYEITERDFIVIPPGEK